MAERVGFEPTVEFPPTLAFEERAPSTARTPLPRKFNHSSGVQGLEQRRACVVPLLRGANLLFGKSNASGMGRNAGTPLSVFFVARAETGGQFFFLQANYDQGEGPPQQQDQPGGAAFPPAARRLPMRRTFRHIADGALGSTGRRNTFRPCRSVRHGRLRRGHRRVRVPRGQKEISLDGN